MSPLLHFPKRPALILKQKHVAFKWSAMSARLRSYAVEVDRGIVTAGAASRLHGGQSGIESATAATVMLKRLASPYSCSRPLIPFKRGSLHLIGQMCSLGHGCMQDMSACRSLKQAHSGSIMPYFLFWQTQRGNVILKALENRRYQRTLINEGR